MLPVILLFYRNFRIVTHAVAWGGWLVAGTPMGEKLWSFLALLFWLKLASYGVIWVLVHTFFRQVYLFYQNLGYSVTVLYAGAFGLDMFLFFGLLTIISWSSSLF
ncbi:MAG: hypothetical protein U0X91_12570 [Spirosomataceae bacterium]